MSLSSPHTPVGLPKKSPAVPLWYPIEVERQVKAKEFCMKSVVFSIQYYIPGPIALLVLFS